MRRRSTTMVDGRAILGVVALYALLLQAFLAFAAPSYAMAQPGEVLCAEHASGAPQDKAHADCHPCCTIVHVGSLGSPLPTASAAPWPKPGYSTVAWHSASGIFQTGTPVRSGSARGPPTV